MVQKEISEPVLKECSELVAIFTKSIETTKNNINK